MDRLTEIEVLQEVLKQRSISKAAAVLGRSVSATSRHLAALEHRLGVRLVNRSTRKLSLTEEGQLYGAEVAAILARLDEAETRIGRGAQVPSGTLRLAVATGFASGPLAGILPGFRQRYPQVQLEILAGTCLGSLIESGADLAIRTAGVEADSSITIRKLAQTRQWLVAAPHYFAEHGVPAHPRDLAGHRWLAPSDSAPPIFTQGAEAVAPPAAPVLVSGAPEVLAASARAGLGLVVLPAFAVQGDLATGRLLPVLPEWDLPRLTINLAFPARRHMPARTRAFIDYILEQARDGRWEETWLA